MYYNLHAPRADIVKTVLLAVLWRLVEAYGCLQCYLQDPPLAFAKLSVRQGWRRRFRCAKHGLEIGRHLEHSHRMCMHIAMVTSPKVDDVAWLSLLDSRVNVLFVHVLCLVLFQSLISSSSSTAGDKNEAWGGDVSNVNTTSTLHECTTRVQHTSTTHEYNTRVQYTSTLHEYLYFVNTCATQHTADSMTKLWPRTV